MPSIEGVDGVFEALHLDEDDILIYTTEDKLPRATAQAITQRLKELTGHPGPIVCIDGRASLTCIKVGGGGGSA